MPGKDHLLLLLLITYLNGPAESFSKTERSHLNGTKRHDFYPATGLTGSKQGVPQRRELPEAMLDPYSVLGVLSFGVYIFYILYSRYRMRGHHNPVTNNPQQQQQGTFFNVDAQENFAHILKMATNIISEGYLGSSNSTLDSDDYFEGVDDSDIRRGRRYARK